MSQIAKYKNKHTGKMAEYLRRETVPNYPSPITVHVLLIDEEEDRLDDNSFFDHWYQATTDRPSDDA